MENVFHVHFIKLPVCQLIRLPVWFYEESSVMFQKNESLGARKEKLVHEAGHVS